MLDLPWTMVKTGSLHRAGLLQAQDTSIGPYAPNRPSKYRKLPAGSFKFLRRERSGFAIHCDRSEVESAWCLSFLNYLIRRIENTKNIELLPYTEIERIEGEQRISALVVRDKRDNATRQHQASHLFIFIDAHIGAQPATDFADDRLALDEKGFIKTGNRLSDDDLRLAGWSLRRAPYLLEASCARIFAAGDVRAGSVKRVASAVGEGSICVQFIHRPCLCRED